MPTTSSPLHHERAALRQILDRLMDEEINLDALCKHAPRLVSVAANIARIDATLESGKETNDTDALRKALRELDTNQSDEEETLW